MVLLLMMMMVVREGRTHHNSAPEAVLDPEEVVGEAEVLRELHQQVDAETRAAAEVTGVPHGPADVDSVPGGEEKRSGQIRSRRLRKG